MAGANGIRVRFFAGLEETFGQREIQLPAQEVPDVEHLLSLICDSPQRRRALFSDSGGLRGEIQILLNGRNIRVRENLATPVRTGDEVSIFAPVWGG